MKNILIKYILYIKQIEGTDYVTTHNESHACDVPFTEEEWSILVEMCQWIDTEQRETAKGKPSSSIL